MMVQGRITFLLISVLAAFQLVACAPPPKVDVVERTVITSRQEAEKIGGQLIRIVQPGDTMHAIAFVNGLDVNQLAAWNDLADTSKLRVGQRIRLTAPLGFVARKQPVQTQKTNNKVFEERPPISATDLPQSAPVTKPNVRPVTETDNKSTLSPAARVFWHWPTKGRVVGFFAVAQGQQGIDIAGELGQTVVAASAGEVVYVGSGLKGYGNLVIIKHNDKFLSAYAHNQNIVVREGDMVTFAQAIGSVGLNKQRKSALHFQIRENGKPVNPLTYLPKI